MANTTRRVSSADEVRTDEDQLEQVNVRLSKRKMRLVRRLIARDGSTLTAYFDRLVTEDIKREKAVIIQDFEDQQERARLEAEAFKRDIEGAFDRQTTGH